MYNSELFKTLPTHERFSEINSLSVTKPNQKVAYIREL